MAKDACGSELDAGDLIHFQYGQTWIVGRVAKVVINSVGDSQLQIVSDHTILFDSNTPIGSIIKIVDPLHMADKIKEAAAKPKVELISSMPDLPAVPKKTKFQHES